MSLSAAVQITEVFEQQRRSVAQWNKLHQALAAQSKLVSVVH